MGTVARWMVSATCSAAAQPDHDGGHRGVAQRELHGRIGKRHPVTRADLGHRAGAGDHVIGRPPVVEHRVGRHDRETEQPGVVDGRGDHRDTPRERQRQQLVRRRAIDQRVATRHHHDVDVAAAHELGEHRGLVHARADRTDHPLLAELDEGVDAFRRGLLPVLVGVVQVDDLEIVEAEPREALIDRTQDAVAAEVPLAAVDGGRRRTRDRRAHLPARASARVRDRPWSTPRTRRGVGRRGRRRDVARRARSRSAGPCRTSGCPPRHAASTTAEDASSVIASYRFPRRCGSQSHPADRRFRCSHSTSHLIEQIAVPARAKSGRYRGRHDYWKSAALSFVTISVPVSMLASTSLPDGGVERRLHAEAAHLGRELRDRGRLGSGQDRRDLIRARVEADRDQAVTTGRLDRLERPDQRRAARGVDRVQLGVRGQDVLTGVETLGLVAVGRRGRDDRRPRRRGCRACRPPGRRATGCRARPAARRAWRPSGRFSFSHVPASWPPAKLSVATTAVLPSQSGMSLSIRTTGMPASTAFCSASATFGLVGVIAIASTSA